MQHIRKENKILSVLISFAVSRFEVFILPLEDTEFIGEISVLKEGEDCYNGTEEGC